MKTKSFLVQIMRFTYIRRLLDLVLYDNRRRNVRRWTILIYLEGRNLWLI